MEQIYVYTELFRNLSISLFTRVPLLLQFTDCTKVSNPLNPIIFFTTHPYILKFPLVLPRFHHSLLSSLPLLSAKDFALYFCMKDIFELPHLLQPHQCLCFLACYLLSLYHIEKIISSHDPVHWCFGYQLFFLSQEFYFLVCIFITLSMDEIILKIKVKYIKF